MASNKRKQDEKHLKMLRELVALPHNKHCFDCNQRGPTYVNMTIGAFVCTSCSGLLRGLNPPHRVKSISMMSFTPDEMDYLSCHGNDMCRRVWLGLYDGRSHAEPDSQDELKVKDFMAAKYEKRRWHVAPTDSMLQDARRQNTIPDKKPEQTRPLRTLGGHIPNLIVQSSQSPRTVAAPPPPVQASAVQHSKPAAPPTQAPQRSATMDLLGDLGGDPFAGPTPASVPASASAGAGGGGFADFANFDGGMSQPSMTPQSMNPQSMGQGFTPVASSGMTAPPSDGGFGAFSSSPMSATTTSSAHIAPPSGGDKYAALADLDSVFGATSSSLPVNWDSGFGGGGRESWAGGGAGGGGGGAGGVPSNGVTASTPATVSNPFGVTTSAAFSQPQSQPGHQVANPFMAPQAAPGGGTGYPQGAPQPPPYGQYGQSVPVGYPVSVAGMPPNCPNTGFPAPQYAASPTGQFQNGGVTAQAPSAGAWGAFGGGGGFAPAGMMPPAQGHYQKPGMPAPQPGGAAPMPGQQQFGVSGWGAQPGAGNPFMNAAAGQQAVPPRGSSTNPFL